MLKNTKNSAEAGIVREGLLPKKEYFSHGTQIDVENSPP